jgi:hypothetical protein
MLPIVFPHLVEPIHFGDPQLCLKRGYAQVPHELPGRALARVIAATADDADRPTKLARQMSPQSFYLWPLRVP